MIIRSDVGTCKIAYSLVIRLRENLKKTGVFPQNRLSFCKVTYSVSIFFEKFGKPLLIGVLKDGF